MSDSQETRSLATQAAPEPVGVEGTGSLPAPPGTATWRDEQGNTVAGRAAQAPTPPLPQEFGRYRIVRLLGEGGMGAVYLAHDSLLERAVALKFPRFGRGDAAAFVKRFYREARAAAGLRHPNLCPVFDVGQVGGVHHIAMAYIEGRPLSQVLREEHPLPGQRVAGLVRQLALALAEAHRHGIVHRDLKPANIMIDGRGHAARHARLYVSRASPRGIRGRRPGFGHLRPRGRDVPDARRRVALRGGRGAGALGHSHFGAQTPFGPVHGRRLGIGIDLPESHGAACRRAVQLDGGFCRSARRLAARRARVCVR